MIIVGELINASRQEVKSAIDRRDEVVIQNIARRQQQAGADYIDINAGIFGDREAEHLRWLVVTVQTAVDLPCCIDSPSPRAIEAALSVHRGTAMLNSISLEKDRFQPLLPLIEGSDLKVVALCMSDEGMPETSDQRLAIAGKIIEGLQRHRVDIANIHVDPLVQPIAINPSFGPEFLSAIERIMTLYPGIHTMCGLSNISFGLPHRRLLNRTFMSMAIARGLDGAIINPLDREMIATVKTAEALHGRDGYCKQFIKAHRAGLFDRAE